MTRGLLLAALVLGEGREARAEGAQDRSRVDELLSSITDQDSRASFRAIAALVALDREHRKATEEGATKLPAFYREALLSELCLRDELGEPFGREVRVTLKGESLAAAAHAAELETLTGLRLETSSLRRQAGEPIAFEPGERSAMEALVELCAKAKVVPGAGSSSTIVLNPSPNEMPPWCYRNFALFPGYVSLAKKIDFSGKAAWKGLVWCSPLSDPGVRPAGWSPEFRLIEAVTDKGVLIEAAPKDRPTAFRTTDEDAPKSGYARAPSFTVALRLPDPLPEKIARLRGVATVQLAKSVREFSLAGTGETARAEDDDFEVVLTDGELGETYQPEAIFTVRPKKMKPEQLLALPLRAEPAYKGLGRGQTHYESKIVGKMVEYRVRWWPFDYSGIRDGRPELESLKVSMTVGHVERPVYIELRDLPLK